MINIYIVSAVQFSFGTNDVELYKERERKNEERSECGERKGEREVDGEQNFRQIYTNRGLYRKLNTIVQKSVLASGAIESLAN